MKKILVLFVGFFMFISIKSQENEILLGIKYDMPIDETTKIIREEPKSVDVKPSNQPIEPTPIKLDKQIKPTEEKRSKK